MLDVSMQQLLMRLGVFAVIAAVHGYVLAWVARALGDSGPAYDGRVSFVPWRHMRSLGTVSALFFLVGWLRLPRIDRHELRRPAIDPVLIALAGIAASAVLAIAVVASRSLAVTALPPDAGRFALLAMDMYADMTAWFLALNLLPLPPLTMGLLWHCVARGSSKTVQTAGNWVTVVLFVLVMIGWLRPAVAPLRSAILQLLTL